MDPRPRPPRPPREATLVSLLQAMAGVELDPSRASGSAVAWDPTDTYPAVPKDAVRERQTAGLEPAGHHLVCVRLPPSKRGGPLVVEVEFETDAVEDHEVELGEGKDGEREARLLFAYGEGELEEIPGVHVIDVGEDTEEGYAPSVRIVPPGKKGTVLDAAPAAAPPAGVEVLAQDMFGEALRGWGYSLVLPGGGTREGTLEDGSLTLEELAEGSTLRLIPPDEVFEGEPEEESEGEPYEELPVQPLEDPEDLSERPFGDDGWDDSGPAFFFSG